MIRDSSSLDYILDSSYSGRTPIVVSITEDIRRLLFDTETVQYLAGNVEIPYLERYPITRTSLGEVSPNSHPVPERSRCSDALSLGDRSIRDEYALQG